MAFKNAKDLKPNTGAAIASRIEVAANKGYKSTRYWVSAAELSKLQHDLELAGYSINVIGDDNDGQRLNLEISWAS